MHRPTDPLGANADPLIEAALKRLTISSDLNADLMAMLDIAIRLTGANMGTLQRYDDHTNSLKLVAGRGFSSHTLGFFGIVRRDTNSSCAAAFTQRMRVFVEDIATNYLFVGTPELDMLSAEGVKAVQSTPLISSSGRLRGMVSTHFHKAQTESAFDHAPLDRLAVRIADSLEERESRVARSQNSATSGGLT